MKNEKWSIDGLAKFWASGMTGKTEEHIAAVIELAVLSAMRKAADWIADAEGEGVADDFCRDFGIKT